MNVVKQFEKVNRELWVVFSMFIIAAVMNFVVSGQRMVLAFYTLPTVFSAYHYGRRHATLTAFASVLLVVLLVWANPIIVQNAVRFQGEQWLDIVVWGGILLVTGYTMGSLYEHKDKQLHELRETYLGILMILRQFISNDKYTENHSYRVSVYATKIAAQLNLDQERIEDIRAAALLHDIGKLDVSRQILYKAARLTESEVVQMQEHVEPRRGHSRAGRRIAPARAADHPLASRQVRRVGLHGVAGREHSRRGAGDHGRGRLRLTHERPAVPQGDGAARGARDHHAGLRQGVRSEGRRRVRHGVP